VLRVSVREDLFLTEPTEITEKGNGNRFMRRPGEGQILTFGAFSLPRPPW
jgi:hypothetical protein